MINLFRFCFALVVLAIGVVYTLPNLYSDYPALVISSKGEVFNEIDQLKIKRALADHGLNDRVLEFLPKRVTVFFDQSSDQKIALKALRPLLGEAYSLGVAQLRQPSGLLSFLGAKPMFLGLDLSGGVHFLIQVNIEDVLSAVLSDASVKFQQAFLDRGFSLNVETIDNALLLSPKGVSWSMFESLIRSVANQLDAQFSFGFDEAASQATAQVDPVYLKQLQQLAIDQNMTTLRNRVGELGVEQPIVQRQGFDRIVVELAGIQEVEQARSILGSVAVIEFHMLNDNYDKNQGFVPFDTKLYPDQNGRPTAIYREVIVGGDQVVNAVSSFDQQTNSPIVSISLNSSGGNKMLAHTKKNVGRYMAVLYKESTFKTVDQGDQTIREKVTQETVVSVAKINSTFGDRFQIEGLSNPEASKKLAIFLRSGALATSLDILEERVIGASLGEQNIQMGLYSIALGLLLVLGFMLWRYRLMGIVANVALVSNIVLMIACLSMLQATLTLPGIAGILLTVGISVDANVIIFERIREQIRLGLSPMRCIDNGYREAFSAIIDANITTFIAAIVLFLLGSGAIKGFAVTLSIGIVTSIFSAMFMTKSIVSVFLDHRRIKRLSI